MDSPPWRLPSHFRESGCRVTDGGDQRFFPDEQHLSKFRRLAFRRSEFVSPKLTCLATADQTQDGVGISRFQSVLHRRLLILFPNSYVTLETTILETVPATRSRGSFSGLQTRHDSHVPTSPLGATREALRFDGDRRHRCRSASRVLLNVTGGVT